MSTSKVEEEAKKVEEAKKEVDERLERCIPLAEKIVYTIANSDYDLRNLKREEIFDIHSPIANSIIRLMINNSVKYTDTQFVFSIARRVFDHVESIVHAQLENSLNAANTILWKENHLDVTVGKVHEVLIESAKEEKKETEDAVEDHIKEESKN